LRRGDRLGPVRRYGRGSGEENDLQLLTRRLHEWRVAHGSEAHWNLLIGRDVLAGDMSLVDFVRSV
jgi:hypothetical protein